MQRWNKNIGERVSGAVEPHPNNRTTDDVAGLSGRLRRENLSNACRWQLSGKGQTLTRWRPTHRKTKRVGV